MAVTSIWAVTVRMDNAINYVMNPEKTVDKPELRPEAVAARKAVGDVINYAVNAEKTEQMMYVTGINCTPEKACEEFMETKRFWNKTDGRLAYHGYQSFLEGDGDITAKQAHDIGVKLAQELWGDRFEVVVATHLNTGHYHNHILLNSVSFVDGNKYRRTPADYNRMRTVSDRLCKEAKLNVIESPSSKRGKSYDEWRAEREGRSTIRGTIREDIDYAIKFSRSERDFAKTMKELCYEFKFFKPDGTPYEHPGIKPPGAKGYFRLRSLGDDYLYDSIRKRIIENTIVPGMPLLSEKTVPSALTSHANITGLASAYRRYCIRLYILISNPKKFKREYVPMALRDDIAKLDKYIEHMYFLYRHNIEDKQSLIGVKYDLQAQINSLKNKRTQLYSKKKYAVRHNNGSLVVQAKAEIRETSGKIRELEKQVKLCDAVAISSDKVIKYADTPLKKSRAQIKD